ncbi:hypothetical protein FIV42_27575 [Persicimonas caeni]|uniref:Periplasmic chaperone PpiD n=1 Tax=Persicimonas caeni TaxID=2292766 RepID=A0A4Y6Q1B7_PERCE|nr:SurA N-terminal domain-containing protein [Persicimonas caeni]QDG54368.1 hypothetical protein FIV42_27575 [Persicimonas caeni]QED35589.1 hypothetical protein FRD00_27570 [Persicimonas caeni]
MLEDVRRAARSGFSYILVAGLIVIFAFFFGVPADSCGGGAPGARRHVASVAGEDVHTDDLNVIYNRVYGTRDRGDEAQIQRQQAQALKAYLIIELLAHKAREAGLRVSDEEFKAFMANPATHLSSFETTNYMRSPMNIPELRAAYGNQGSWDGTFYKRYVQNMLRVSLPDYEQFKREEMLARKYLTLMEMQIGVLPQEVENLDQIRNTKLNLEFVKFQPEQLAEHVQVTDEQVQQFIANNKDKVEKYYEENQADYETPEKLAVRRIYIERGAEVDGKTAEQRFTEAKKRIEGGEDFATVAGEINDALKAEQGFMKLTSAENMSQDIVEALEGVEVGDFREIKNDTEFMLVKLEERQEAVKTPLADVQNEIARDLLQQEKVDELVAKMSEKLVAKAKEAGSLEKALAELEPKMNGEGEGTDAEGEGEKGALAIVAPDTLPWSAVEVGTTGEFTLEGQDLSSMFRGQLPPGVSLGRSPWDRIPKIGQSRKLAVDAFTKLTEEKPLAEKPYAVNDTKVVVRLKSKTTPDASADKAEGGDEKPAAGADDELLAELRDEKVQGLLGRWELLFASPSMDYGPWLEQQYEQAVKSGVIDLESANDPMVAMIDPTAVAATAEGAEGAPVELSPTEAPAQKEAGDEKE